MHKFYFILVTDSVEIINTGVWCSTGSCSHVWHTTTWHTTWHTAWHAAWHTSWCATCSLIDFLHDGRELGFELLLFGFIFFGGSIWVALEEL